MKPTDWLPGTPIVFSEVSDRVQVIVDQMTDLGRPLRVLEAGCGSRSHIRLGGDVHVAGIDTAEDQLQGNESLDERILGDIQTFPLEPCSFDIIFCWDVLEHLRHPDWAIQNLVRALREGGILVVGSPVVNSVKGTITKFTPLWFHVFVFRHILGNRNAGTKGYGPFPTFFKSSMSPRAIEEMAREQRLAIEQSILYRDQMEERLRSRHWTIDVAIRIVNPLLKLLSLGRIDASVTDFVMVLRKPTK